jgi:hypothetical protein
MKTIKAIGLVFLGLIIWTITAYVAYAFVKAEINPFLWEQTVRDTMLFIVFIYIAFIPLLIWVVKGEL